MAAPLTAPLPEGLVLGYGYTVTLDAIDPATGASVADVAIVEGAVTGEQTVDPAAGPPTKTPGPFMLVPGPQGGAGDLIGGGTPHGGGSEATVTG